MLLSSPCPAPSSHFWRLSRLLQADLEAESLFKTISMRLHAPNSTQLTFKRKTTLKALTNSLGWSHQPLVKTRVINNNENQLTGKKQLFLIDSDFLNFYLFFIYECQVSSIVIRHLYSIPSDHLHKSITHLTPHSY